MPCDQIQSVRSIAGDALTAIQDWCSFDIASCATLCSSTDRPPDSVDSTISRIACIPHAEFDMVDSFDQSAKMVDMFSLSSKLPACIYASVLDMAISLFTSVYYLWYKILGLKIIIEFHLRIFSDYHKFPANGPSIGWRQQCGECWNLFILSAWLFI